MLLYSPSIVLFLDVTVPDETMVITIKLSHELAHVLREWGRHRAGGKSQTK